MTFSSTLLDDIRVFKRNLIRDLSVRSNLIEQLVFVYNCSIATESLFVDAYHEAASKYKDTFTRGTLGNYYSVHLVEESGELEILEEDLKAAGVDFNAINVDEIAMALIGSQYYMIKHVHPVCFLGYLAVVEGDHPTMELVETLEKIHGADVLRFVRLHAINDVEHSKELLGLIDLAPEPLQKLIKISAENSLRIMLRREIYGTGIGALASFFL